MIETDALRNKILELAVQGKLVPQDSNDELASVLLDRIREEKQRLYAEGKLKKKDIAKDSVIFKGDDNSYYEKYNDGTQNCIDDEIPYDIPNNWEWRRLNTIVDVRDGTHDTPQYVEEGVPLFTSKNLGENGLDYSNVKYISYEDSKKINERSGVDIGDILFAMIGTIGNPVMVDKDIEMSIKNVALFKFSYRCELNHSFILYYLKKAQRDMQKEAKGGLQPFVSLTYLRNVLVPVPPINEQRRIVDLVEKMFELLETIDKAQDELEKDNNLLSSKILDLAIRGNIVSQDSNDEPASVLLDKIREERQDLFSEGKLKKKDLTNDSVIYEEDGLYYEKCPNSSVNCVDDEIPFSVPKGWSWCRLQMIADIFGRIGYRGYTKNDLTTEGEGAITLSPSNIVDSEMDYSSCSYISWEKYEESPEIMVEEGDILFVKTASIGKTAIVKNLPEKATINPQFVVLKNRRINTEYLCLYLQSEIALKKYNELVAGNAVPTISQEKLNALYVPIPPLSEQKRIVDKTNELINYCKKID